MTLEEKHDFEETFSEEWNNKIWIRDNVLSDEIWQWIETKIDEAKNGQRDIAGSMANEMQRIAMRYNTVVSTEALNMEFKQVFDKYFPSPKETKQ